MGNSHYRSHLVAAQAGVKIRGFNAIASMNSLSATNIAALNTITANVSASTPIVRAQNFVQIGVGNSETGDRRFILTSNYNTIASVVAQATLFAKTDLPATNLKGSLVLGRGRIFSFTLAQTATVFVTAA